ncbi:helix-turn-helix domain-containing protein [Candidatus Avoscillospira sp. LCP25S3_F1]|uniref:helix-turn-helix domain-containing protein n=1 Tax=Candidatus Avoscillospira sp. LCP25S3_F1 TaxID=3438825 RepID=UPI003F8E3268
MTELARRRRDANISQATMADTLSISVPAYSQYENGIRNIPAAIAIQIAEILSCEVDDIFLPVKFTVSKF